MALMVAGTHSGCGKSTVSLGIMAALGRLGLTVQPFKAGPDFIDPGLHRLITGRVSRNLDAWMCGEHYVRRSLAMHSQGAQAAVIEGVMGYYDGGERSSAALAGTLGANVLLVVDAYGMAESAGALVHGYKSFGAKVDAVLFNRVGSERHYERLREAVRDVEVLGYLPRRLEFGIPERHLGLHVAEESPISTESIDMLATTLIAHADMKRIADLALACAASFDTMPYPTPIVRIAVARDPAFCFYYEDNLDMLRREGADIVYFSPLADPCLPADIDAIYLGGGYPELHAEALEANTNMRQSVREWVINGRPLLAECGGFMYLGKGIHNSGNYHAMCGALPIETELMPRRSALGYREVRMAARSILGPEGVMLKGHEYHYSRVTRADESDGVRYNIMAETGQQIASAMRGRTIAGYTHMHFGSNGSVASNFVKYISESRS